MNKFMEMSDQYLIDTYFPNVYQKTVFSIDFQRIRDKEISVLSFDVDDTIVPLEGYAIDKATVTFFERLKFYGFFIWLISNNIDDKRVSHFAARLGVPYIANAKKPRVAPFYEIITQYQREHEGIVLQPEQMAHIGNSMLSDVACGNIFGATTCLVRNVGKLSKAIRMIHPEEKKLQKALEMRGIWRKHHLQESHDQYYQLNERPRCAEYQKY